MTDQYQPFDFSKQAQAVEAPAGLQQSATAAAGFERAQSDAPADAGYKPFNFSALGKSSAEQGYTLNGSKWYTGANYASLQNGWDSTFEDKFQTQWNDALKAGTAKDYFGQKNATGVATWDHDVHDEATGTTKHVAFGDVYQDGRKVGNVYDDFDKDTANLLMAPRLLSADQQKQLFGSSEYRDETQAFRDALQKENTNTSTPEAAAATAPAQQNLAPVQPGGQPFIKSLDWQVEKVRQQNATRIPDTLSSQKFQQDVAAKAKDFSKGAADDLSVLAGGGAGGAAIGAGVASVIPGVGTVAGGVVGGLIGAAGAWLNKDELVEQAARATVITQIANKDSGLLAGITTGLGEFSGVAGRTALNPVSNLLHGTVDAASKGGVGDGVSSWYAVNPETGNRTLPNWLKVADLGANVVDSLATFASPAGLSLYTAQMTGSIGGEVGQLVTSGKQFDYSTGRMDSIFDSPLSAVAGIGNIGIDAVQLGMARGLASKATNAASLFGKSNADNLGYGRTMLSRISEKLSPEYIPAAARAQGAVSVSELGGRKFFLNEAGEAVGKRATLSILAPSEAVAGVYAGGVARMQVLTARRAALRDGAVTTDDVYRAANMLASGNRKLNTALMNAFGEGTEEAVQAILEPVSHGHMPSYSDIVSSFFQGGAAGLGMGLGINTRTVSPQDRQLGQARTYWQLMNPGATDKQFEDMWRALPDGERKQLATASPLVAQAAQASFEKVKQDWARQQSMGAVGIEWHRDNVRSVLDMALAKATMRTDQGFVITQLESYGDFDQNHELTPDTFPANAVASSAVQMYANMQNRMRGLQVQSDWSQQQIADLQAQPESPERDAQIAQHQQQLDTVNKALELQEPFLSELELRIGAVMNTHPVTHVDLGLSDAERELEALKLNEFLRDAFHGNLDELQGQRLDDAGKRALQYAATMIYTRDPQDHAGSYLALLPQVSWTLSKYEADNNLHVSHAVLSAISGDFDGDKLRAQNQLVLQPRYFEAARAGLNFVGSGNGVNIGAMNYEEAEIDGLRDAFQSTDVTFSGLAAATVDGIRDAITGRYSEIPAEEFEEIFDAFRDQLEAGNREAVANLRDALWSNFSERLIAHGVAAGHTNEILWIQQAIHIYLQRFQRGWADRDFGQPKLDPVTKLPVPQSANHWKILQLPGATRGTMMNLLSAGVTMFRNFQKLHYSVIGAPIATEDRQTSGLLELARLYEQLGQLATRETINEVRGKDDIVKRVQVQLMALAHGAQQAGFVTSSFEGLPVVANMLVDDVDFDATTGEPVSRGKVTLAQALLRRSLEIDRREKDAIWEQDTQLQARHYLLGGLTRPSDKSNNQHKSDYNPVRAEMAFLEVFGDMQAEQLIGEESNRLGRQLTLNQVTRYLASLSPEQRRVQERQLTHDDLYTEGHTDRTHLSMPYNLDEVRDVTAYRAAVDAVIAVARQQLTIDDAGRLHGLKAKQEEAAAESFHAMWKSFRAALNQFVQMGRNDNETEAVTVARFLQEFPTYGRQMLDVLPRDIATAVTTNTGSDVLFEDWFFDMLTAKDAEAAEMILLRNVMLKQWYASGAHQAAIEGDETTERNYDRLTRRSHRLIYKLLSPATGGSGLRFHQFFTELMNATSRADFLKWVNTTPGMHANQVPLLLWVDDVADFDADKSGGGWSNMVAGAEMREAIRTLRQTSEKMVAEVDAERQSWLTDAALLGALDKVDRDLANGVPVSQIDPIMLGRHRALAQALDYAADGQLGIGPNAAFFETVGAIIGFNAHSHTKGQSADNVVQYGNLEVLRDAVGRVTNYERIRAALHTQGLDSASAYLGEFAKSAQRAMTDDGRVIEWPKPNVRTMIELFQNPSTRQMAREMLFPSVIERTATGGTTKQFTLGKSLTALLDNSSMRDLYNPGDTGTPSYEKSATFLTYLGTLVRSKFNGGFSLDVLRNDLAVAKTTGLSRAASLGTAEGIATETVQQLASVLQDLGAITDRASLETLKADVRSALHAQFMARRLKVSSKMPTAAELTEARDAMLAELEFDAKLQEEQLLNTAATQTGAEKKASIAAATEVIAKFQRTRDAIVAALDPNYLAQLENQYLVDTDNPDQTQLAQIQSYVVNNRAFLSRLPQMTPIVDAIRRYHEDPNNVQAIAPIPAKDWRKLGLGIIALKMDQSYSHSGTHITVMSYADPKDRSKFSNVHQQHKDFSRYWDPTFSYLLDEMLDFDGPVLQAAREARNRAGLGTVGVSTADVQRKLLTSVFDNLGEWTSDVPRAAIEATERLYSAPAEAGISIPGNIPKRTAAEIGATARTFALPDESMLSGVQLKAADLDAGLFDETLTLALPNGEVGQRPLAQLNNRFARSVVLHTPAGDVDLLNTTPVELGHTWSHEPSVAASGYKVINVTRLKNAVGRYLRDNGGDLSDLSLSIELFHPEARPADQQWFHNVYFEGVSYESFGDYQSSLLSSLWYSADALNPSFQRQALDAAKTGDPAFQVIAAPSVEDRDAIEADWSTDLAKVIREKAKLLMTTDFGGVTLADELYNAVYKDTEIRHYVVAGDRLLTANEVIALQKAGQPLPDGAQLWIPSDEVLRTLLGEPGLEGALTPEVSLSLLRHTPFTGQVPESLRPGMGGKLETSRVAARASMSQVSVRPQLPRALKNAYDLRVEYLAALEEDGHRDRQRLMNSSTHGAQESFANVADTFGPYLRAQDLSMSWIQGGVPFIAPRDILSLQLSQRVLAHQNELLSGDSLRRGWILRDIKDPAKAPGVISIRALEDASLKPGEKVLPKDLVGVEVSSFYDHNPEQLAEETLHKALAHLVERGATVVLGEAGGSSNRTAEAAGYLLSLGYQQVAGSNRIYAEPKLSAWSQNQKARLSSLVETQTVSAKNRLAVLLVPGIKIDENAAAVVDPRYGSLKGLSTKVNLVPVDAFWDFNVPLVTARSRSVSDTKEQLRSLLGATETNTVDTKGDGFKLLAQQAQAETDDQRKEFADALNRMLDRWSANPDGGVLPAVGDEFGLGDVIPLVGPGNKILLYRHGMKAPKRAEVEAMMRQTLPSTANAVNVAVYPSKREPAATVNTGKVISFDPRAKFGLQVELNVALQVFGDKQQLEWNGMKYVLTTLDKRLAEFPEQDGFFANGWGVELVADLASAVKKESFLDWVNNPRNAIAFFGMDFTDNVARTFFPGQQITDTVRQNTLNLLKHFAASDQLPLEGALDIVDSLNPGSLMTDLLASLPADLGANTDALTGISDQSSVDAKITLAMLAYLMTPGGRGNKVDHVLKSGGFNNLSSRTDGGAHSVKMPDLFTRVFNSADTHAWLIRELNKQLHKPNASVDGSGYVLHDDWTFEAITAEGKRTRGYLQFAEAYPSGDNPITNGQGFDATEKQNVSQHAAFTAFGATGAMSAFNGDLKRVSQYAHGTNVPSIAEAGIEGFWQRFSAVSKNDPATQPWRDPTAGELERRARARELRAAFYEDIDQSDWTDAEKLEYDDIRKDFARAYGIDAKQRSMVDHLVRFAAYQPVGENEAGEAMGNVRASVAIALTKEMIDNARNHMHPLHGLEVPITPVDVMWTIFESNMHRKDGFRMYDGVGDDAKALDPKNFDDWVKTVFGSMELDNATVFDPLALLATDSLMHGYQEAVESVAGMPVSMDALLSAGLIANGRLLVSLSPKQDLLAQSTVHLTAGSADLKSLLKGQRITGRYRGRFPSAHAIEQRRQQRLKWRKELGLPMPVDVTKRNFLRRGEQYVNHVTNANSVWHMAYNLRIGSSLINPGLWVGAPIETFIRQSIDNLANVASMSGTGVIARGQSRLTERLADTKVGELLSSMGLEAQLTTAEQNILNGQKVDGKRDLGTIAVLGQRSDFKALVYGDLMYLRPWMPGAGKVSKALAHYARFGTFFQDPYWGMRANTIARKYIEAVIMHYEMTQSQQSLSVAELAALLENDPQWLKKHDELAHNAGINAVGQLRSLKQTPLSKMLMGVINPMAESNFFLVNVAGNILKLRFPFVNYVSNLAVTMTGMQGVSDTIAMALHGRNKGFFGKIQQMLSGSDPDFKPEFDMSDVIEGLDYTRSFIRSGATMSSLFLAGLLAQGLGLSGEDDEAKKRRLMAKMQGVPINYDPRELQNDFRNSDATFLDNLSWIPGVKQFAMHVGDKTRIPVQLPWTLNQFINPLIGFEKFYETGDPKNILWGYENALRGMPMVNTTLWNDAVESFSDLMSQTPLDGSDVPQSYNETMTHKLVSGVGILERMLFENSFLSSLYIYSDSYDRDPYATPMTDSNGVIQRSGGGTNSGLGSGTPRPTDLLRTYVDAEGNVREGYIKRGDVSSQIHALTENRPMLAALMSMMSGGIDSDFLRWNMVPKIRKVELPTVQQDAAEGFILDVLKQQKAEAKLTPEEAKQIARNMAIEQLGVDQGQYVPNKALEPLMLSLIDEHSGRETLAYDGARAVFRGLHAGVLTTKDASLNGIYITPETRQAIQAEWAQEIIQQGVDWGLTEDQAKKRFDRIFYGHSTSDPEATGLKDILWSNDIPWSDTLQYNQLNTTYVMGPDGRPMATGWQRASILGAAGIAPTPQYGADGGQMGQDQRLNSTDLVHNLNTGLRALEPVKAAPPTAEEIADRIEKAVKAATGKSYTPSVTNGSAGTGKGGSGSGGSGFRGSWNPDNPNFARMNSPRVADMPFDGSIPSPNTSNPIIRRASIRRERIESERGRLNQWQ